MNIGELYSYLGDLMRLGVPKNMPATILTDIGTQLPVEICEAFLLKGRYGADQSLMEHGQIIGTGPCLLLSGGVTSLTELEDTHQLKLPPLEAPASARD